MTDSPPIPPTRRRRILLATALAAAAVLGAVPRGAFAATGSATVLVEQRGTDGQIAIGGCWQPVDLATGEALTELCDADDPAGIDGTVVLPGLADGDYQLTQRVEPDAYRGAAPLTITLAAGETRTVRSSHDPLPVLVVRTEVEGTAIGGSCWLLRAAGAAEGGEEFCDADDGADDGAARIAQRSVDELELVHLRAPAGFGRVAATLVQVGDVDRTLTFVLPALGQAPVNVEAPTVQGAGAVGAELTGHDGTWEGEPLELDRAWLRCDADGAACTLIAAGTATYAVVAADQGSTLRYQVTALNDAGSATALSAPVVVARQPLPQATTNPTLSPTTPAVGTSVVASPGTWTGSVSFTYQWQRCSSPTACTDIPGSTATSYVAQAADGDVSLRVAVTATNPSGATTAYSAATAPVDNAPVALSPPIVTGQVEVGGDLNATDGTWRTYTGGLSFTRQWLRCDGATCTPTGVTTSRYHLTSVDAGYQLRFDVTARDAGGSTTASSVPTYPVADLKPVNVTLPTISGDVRIGAQLRATTGSWTSNAGPLSYEYLWGRCTDTGCPIILGQTRSTYTITTADVGARIRVLVRAVNRAGFLTAISETTAVVVALPPVNTAPPTISGTVRIGQTLWGSPGTWTSGAGTVRYTYTWGRCGTETDVCPRIAGADRSTYTVTRADAGFRLRLLVYAINNDGWAYEVSSRTVPVPAFPPVNVSRPTISGTLQVGSRLTGDVGSWSSDGGPMRYTYTWGRCDAAGHCPIIAGADDNTYRITRADVGSRLRLLVYAINNDGYAHAMSVMTPVITR